MFLLDKVKNGGKGNVVLTYNKKSPHQNDEEFLV